MSDQEEPPTHWLSEFFSALSRPIILSHGVNEGRYRRSLSVVIIYSLSPFRGDSSLTDILNRSLQEAQNHNTPVSDSLRLPTFEIKSTARFTDPCTVCQEDFKTEEWATKLPCSHVFHKNCIEPWFENNNSCPVCRYELPVDDPEMEQLRQERMAERDREIENRPKICELLDFDECQSSEDCPVSPLTNCGHHFHPECVSSWARNDGQDDQDALKCPVCHELSAWPACEEPPVSTLGKRKRRAVRSMEEKPAKRSAVSIDAHDRP